MVIEWKTEVTAEFVNSKLRGNRNSWNDFITDRGYIDCI